MRGLLGLQDPCYLGRYNNIYDAPRRILTSIPGVELVEMRNAKSFSNCCGAGGGRIWLEDQQLEKIRTLRTQEVIKTESDVVASACPLCLSNLANAVNSLEPGIKNKDIAEMVYFLHQRESVRRSFPSSY